MKSSSPCFLLLFSVFALGLIDGLQGASRAVAPQAVTTAPKGVSASDWKGILAAHESAQRRIESHEDGVYATRNAGQQWRVRFDEHGFVAQPDSGGWQWGLELRRYGYGDGIPSAKKATAITENDRLVYRRDGVLSEWYVNRTDGLLQGWTLARRPSGNAHGKPLELTLAVRGSLKPQLTKDRSVTFTDSKEAAVLNYSDLKAWDADGQSLAAHFAVSGRDLVIRVDDRRARYPVTIDPIAQQAYLKASNTDASDSFGYSVAISGNTAVIGAYGEDSNATGVNGNQADNSVSGSGAAYVFVRSGATWTQQAYLKASNTGVDDFFGISVAVSGDTAVIGAYGEDSVATGVNGNQADNTAALSGAAYVFVRSGATWTQQAYLKASNTEAIDFFGSSVAVSGDTVVIGAYREASSATGVNGSQLNGAPSAGAAYVFLRSGATWTQEAYLKASNTELNDRFGYSVAVSGDTAVIGAYQEDSVATGINGTQLNGATDSGAAYVFVRSAGVWAQQAYLKASNTEGSDFFGSSVAISGDTAVIGAEGEASSATGVNGNQADNTATGSGAAYVFVRNAGVWAQEAYLKASNTEAGDIFGFSVAISGDIAVIGAEGEASSATGVNGNQADNTATGSGAAYVFVRSAGAWAQQAYLKASNTEAGDIFSSSVAVSGDTAVIGAEGEASSATGVNGSQLNGAGSSGAAYVFQFLSSGQSTPPPTLTAKGKKKYTTSRARVTLRGTATNATQVVFKVKGAFKPAKGSAAFWKIKSLRLKPGRNIVKVQAIGPGGTSKILKLIITYTAS